MQANELFANDHEQRNRELQRVWTEYAGSMETVTDDTADAFEELSVSIRDSLANAFEDAIFEADNFGDSITSILDGIARQIARAGFIDPLASGIGDFIKSQTSGFDLGSVLPSFDVGAWNLPNDMIAKVHKGEMIIPASEANAIRNGGRRRRHNRRPQLEHSKRRHPARTACRHPRHRGQRHGQDDGGN